MGIPEGYILNPKYQDSAFGRLGSAWGFGEPQYIVDPNYTKKYDPVAVQRTNNAVFSQEALNRQAAAKALAERQSLLKSKEAEIAALQQRGADLMTDYPVAQVWRPTGTTVGQPTQQPQVTKPNVVKSATQKPTSTGTSRPQSQVKTQPAQRPITTSSPRQSQYAGAYQGGLPPQSELISNNGVTFRKLSDGSLELVSGPISSGVGSINQPGQPVQTQGGGRPQVLNQNRGFNTSSVDVNTWGLPVATTQPGYIPPRVRDGYDITEASKQPILHGQPIDAALAGLLAKRHAQDQASFNASLAGTRTRQLMEVQNDPGTYQLAQQYTAQYGLPADKAFNLAISQRLGSQGAYLGLGASLPAAQQALDGVNNQNAALATLWGTPYQGYSVNNGYQVGPTGISQFTTNSDGTVTAKVGQNTYTGLSGPEIAAGVAFANPSNASQFIASTALGGAVAGKPATKSAASAGTAQQVSTKADQLIKEANKPKKTQPVAGAANTQTIPGT